MNIEQMAREAGGSRVGDTDQQCWSGDMAFDDAALERFTALVRDQALDDASHACKGIGAGYAGASRRLEGQHATHAAGQRDGANECAAAILALKERT